MLSLLDTPSSGVDETLLALYNAHALHGRRVSPQTLLRHFPPHTSLDELNEVLTSLESAVQVDDDGHGNFGLTTAGLTFSRANRPRGSRFNVV